MKRKILIVDDEEKLRKILEYVVQEMEHLPVTAKSGEEALEILNKKNIDLIITDYKMPGINGLELLKEVKLMWPKKPVILVTAFGSIDSAVEAMKEGAADYITKPFDIEPIKMIINNTIKFIEIEEKADYFFDIAKAGFSFENIIGKSAKIKDSIFQAKQVANTDAPVLLLGESGTGKELFSKAIHFGSKRASGPFMAINCASIPESLMESELFGYEKGAFTGAYEKTKGKILASNGGTLFLDEIGEMSPALQAKLLRVLEDKKITPVGSNEQIEVDFRLITATNRNLKKEVDESNFRSDLYYRINVFTVHLPPLRERKGDIIQLAQYFIGKYSKELGKKILILSDEVIEVFDNYDWKGNIRELENVIERACIIADKEIKIKHLPPEMFNKRENNNINTNNQASVDLILPKNGIIIEELEKNLIKQSLERANNNVSKAAKLLGLSRPTLRYRMEKYGIIND